MNQRANISCCIALLLAALSLPACSASFSEAAGFEPVILKNPVPADALSIDTLFAPRESRFDILRGDHLGETLILTTTREDDRATITRTLESGTVLNTQRIRLQLDAAAETGFENNERNVIVRLSPRQALWPISGSTQNMRIRLPRLDKPDKLKERGTATSTTTIESIDLLETPDGPIEAVRVRTVFESDLRAATARRVTDRWYTNELGLVAERWDEIVKAFGLTVEQSARTIRLRVE